MNKLSRIALILFLLVLLISGLGIAGAIRYKDFVNYQLTNAFDFFGLQYSQSLWARGASWSTLTRWMKPVTASERQQIINSFKQSIDAVRNYRTEATLVEYVPELGRYGTIDFWATFVVPDRAMLRWHNVTSDEWDEQIHIADKIFIHFSRKTSKEGKVNPADIYFDDTNPESIEFSKKISRMLSLERLNRMLSSPKTKVLEVWEDRRHFAIKLQVEGWEEGPEPRPGVSAGDYFVEFEVLRRGMRVHQVEVTALKMHAPGSPDKVFSQGFFDYNGQVTIEAPPREKIVTGGDYKFQY